MRGQFALASWNGSDKRLTLARDHLGHRSMFFLTQPDVVVFCSELAPLLRSVPSGCELDLESAYWYLAFGMPAPGRTLARGIQRVPAAHAAVLEHGRAVSFQRYWTPLSPGAARDAAPEVVENIRTALARAIGDSLQSEEQQGVLLSGGVDSTFLASTLAANRVRPVAFTSSFESRHGMNEEEYASAVAGWLSLPHHVVSLEAAEALELLDTVVLTAAEPCSAWATLTHFKLLSAALQTGVCQLYSGLGADEIFGGYDHMRGYYSRFLRWKKAARLPVALDPFDALLLEEKQSTRRTLYPGIARFFRDSDLRRALHEPYCKWQYAPALRAFYRECRQMKPEAEMAEVMVAHECQHRIPDLLLANFEGVSRRSGVEVAYPFLNPDVVELAAGLSIENRYRTASGKFSLELKRLNPRFKYAMMRVAEDRVPPEILQRPRKSYTAPFGGWFFDPDFAAPVLQRLRRSRLWDAGFIRAEWLDEILARVVPGPNPWVFQLWALLTLGGWYDRFVERPAPTE